MINPTRRQNDLLTYIQSYVRENGCAPSYEEMKVHLGLSSRSGVHRMICGLEERGLIRRLPDHARAIEVVSKRHDFSRLSIAELVEIKSEVDRALVSAYEART